MVSVSELMMDELSRDIVAHDIDVWWEKVVWTIQIWLILFDNLDINVVKIVFAGSIDSEIAAFGVS